MHDESSSMNPGSLGEHAGQRLQRALEQLDAGIARLAIALGLQPDDQTDLFEAVGAHLAAHEADGQAHHGSHQLRINLRGLLTLRSDLIRHCVEEFGQGQAIRVILQAEHHLSALGFKPGADGIRLPHLLDGE